MWVNNAWKSAKTTKNDPKLLQESWFSRNFRDDEFDAGDTRQTLCPECEDSHNNETLDGNDFELAPRKILTIKEVYSYAATNELYASAVYSHDTTALKNNV